ncbi:hypothetical protein K466DRAFT_50806 [Polyporus arcularius HHB13444]|uniref:Uncharacterized protein n=1 Tax=Polyporus arcularius HHB13444 TaxID=1314778 RepID=A0A5C3NR99_9APHY|nr:hypothetical protein K466DRAFT_50806 [Polyporus arcularius HHB13444]
MGLLLGCIRRHRRCCSLYCADPLDGDSPPSLVLAFPPFPSRSFRCLAVRARPPSHVPSPISDVRYPMSTVLYYHRARLRSHDSPIHDSRSSIYAASASISSLVVLCVSVRLSVCPLWYTSTSTCLVVAISVTLSVPACGLPCVCVCGSWLVL